MTDDRLDAARRQRYESLVRAVVEPMRRYALRRSDSATAEDAVGDALLVLWRRLDDVPADGELPWAYAVTRRCLANLERSSRRHRGLTLRIARLDPPAETVAERPDESDDDELHAALRRLSADDQEVLRLWAWEELRPAEIAVVLGLTSNAVSIRLHRAKSRLAAELRAEIGGDDSRAAGHDTSKARVPPTGPGPPGKSAIDVGQKEVDGTADDGKRDSR